MKYIDHLKQCEWKDIKPFDIVKQKEYLDSSENFFVIANRAPYWQDHIMVVPKKDYASLLDIPKEQQLELYEMINKWLKKMYTKYPDDTVNLLLRDGKISEHSNKSVQHLHRHIIPNCPISCVADWFVSDDREFFDEEKYFQEIQRIKKEFC